MNFESFLSRIDEELIAKIVGRSAIQILNTLNTDLARISKLQSILLNIYSPIELINNNDIRNDLFDLLKENEVIDLLGSLGKKNTDNPYSDLKAIRFNLEREQNTLLQYFGINRENIAVFPELPRELECIPKYTLFQHQRKAVEKIKLKLYSGNKRVLLHMPTGSGKTRTAMDIICNHLRNNEPTTVIWLAHTEELCEQAAQEFEKSWSSIGNRNINVYRYWGSSGIDLTNIKDGFIVGGLAKFYNLLKQNSLSISTIANNCTLVVMDEAHMAVAPTFNLNLSTLISFKASLLGLSATPGRTYNNPQVDSELSNFFKKQKVTLEIDGYDNPIDYLIDEGYLAKIENKNLLYQSGLTLSETDLKYLSENLCLSDSFLNNLSQDQKRNILIIQKVEELVTRHKRIIIFALNVKHSNLLATCLQVRGINAYSITGETDGTQRSQLIDLFKSDDDRTLVLCNYGILTTGFDAPKTSCAVITRPTDSLVLYSQMVGRAIRGKKAKGNDVAEIITVVDTALPGFDKIANAFFNWEDVW